MFESHQALTVRILPIPIMKFAHPVQILTSDLKY